MFKQCLQWIWYITLLLPMYYITSENWSKSKLCQDINDFHQIIKSFKHCIWYDITIIFPFSISNSAFGWKYLSKRKMNFSVQHFWKFEIYRDVRITLTCIKTLKVVKKNLKDTKFVFDELNNQVLWPKVVFKKHVMQERAKKSNECLPWYWFRSSNFQPISSM